MELWQLHDQSPGLFYLSLAISFVVTWSVGLTPPVVIRYLLLKRPLQRKAATWTSVGICVVMLFLSVLVTDWAGEKQGSHFWVFFLFFVARWVLERPIPLQPREVRPLNERRP